MFCTSFVALKVEVVYITTKVILHGSSSVRLTLLLGKGSGRGVECGCRFTTRVRSPSLRRTTQVSVPLFSVNFRILVTATTGYSVEGPLHLRTDLLVQTHVLSHLSGDGVPSTFTPETVVDLSDQVTKNWPLLNPGVLCKPLQIPIKLTVYPPPTQKPQITHLRYLQRFTRFKCSGEECCFLKGRVLKSPQDEFFGTRPHSLSMFRPP